MIDVAPEFKRRVHSHLAAEGKTLKQWFLEHAEVYLARRDPVQLPLTMGPSRPPTVRKPAPRRRQKPARKAGRAPQRA